MRGIVNIIHTTAVTAAQTTEQEAPAVTVQANVSLIRARSYLTVTLPVSNAMRPVRT